jgi:hypothetical protein
MGPRMMVLVEFSMKLPRKIKGKSSFLEVLNLFLLWT